MSKRQSHKSTNIDNGNVRATISRQVSQSPEFVSLYTNDTQVQLSPWDVRLIFGLIEDPPTAERKTMSVRRIGEVRMSPEHAKKVLAILAEQLKQYEDSIGIIPQPD
jgi:hypothetical protein